MPETTLWCAIAWLLLAAQTKRLRHHAGSPGSKGIALLRAAAALMFVLPLLRADLTLPGGLWVRLTGAASLAGLFVTSLVSVVPRVVFTPIRLLLGPQAADEETNHREKASCSTRESTKGRTPGGG